MAHPLLTFGDLLRRQPDFFRFILPSLNLQENIHYLGAYYHLMTVGGVILECHSTIGHWIRPARQPLTQGQSNNLTNRLEAIFELDWEFAQGPLVLPPRRLGHRVLLTLVPFSRTKHVRFVIGSACKSCGLKHGHQKNVIGVLNFSISLSLPISLFLVGCFFSRSNHC